MGISIVHPARAMDFGEISARLSDALTRGHVYQQRGSDGLSLYCYSKSAVYEQAWDEITTMSRGLILDTIDRRVVATPFPKFFNLGERLQSIPDRPFEVFEKLDGSLIILFHHQGVWKAATKGSLCSPQAIWAAAWLSSRDLSALVPGTTYLAEALYPANRIVVRYEHTGLVMLGAYDEGGAEVPYVDLCMTAGRLDWPIAKRLSFASVSELLAHAQMLPANEEGFVLRFEDGLRLKIKGDEYKRIHALISRVTPLELWAAMQAADDLAAIRRDLPEEFWSDFDAIVAALSAQIDDLIAEIKQHADSVAHLSDKDVGLRLAQFPQRVRALIFPYRKCNGEISSGRNRSALFRLTRPTSNVLPGYVPSYAVRRIAEDSL